MTLSPPAASARSSSSAECPVTRAIMIWLPSKPISTWTRSSSDRRDHLREHAVDGIRMDEGDLEPEHPRPRLGVDQLGTPGAEVGECGANVCDLVRDVVHSGPAAGEELADRRLRAERREQLDTACPDEHCRGLDALLGDGGPVLDLGAEQPLVGRHGLVEILDGHAEVVDAARLHAWRCYPSARRLRL